ncbi:MAG: hypothetical protein H0T89_24845 [Deltaproteobacteria bacterium]|nr:hypothetical protein [Deltaproteobacteria bacterium]MDQ3298084.1 hypothetical protein [Myxococcota bacterium]
MSQLRGNSCGALFPPDPQSGERELVLPADCNAVILVREAGALPEEAMSRGAITAAEVL